MSAHQLLALFFRITSVWLLLVCFQLYGLAATITHQLGDPPAYIYWLCPVPVMAAIILWMFPRSVARVLLAPHVPGAPLYGRDLAAAGLIIIGLVAIITALPSVLYLIGLAQFIGEFHSDAFMNQTVNLLLSTATQIGFGVILIARPYVLCGHVMEPEREEVQTITKL